MIFGVDPGLANVGWALLLNGGSLHSYGHIETQREDRVGDAQGRMDAVMYGLSTPLRLLAASAAIAGDKVVIEWPGGVGGKNARAALQTVGTASAVYGAAYWMFRGRTERIVRPASVTWRPALAHAWGIPTGKKAPPLEPAIHAGILERFPQLTSLKKKAQPHILDAVGLALYGHLKTTEKKR